MISHKWRWVCSSCNGHQLPVRMTLHVETIGGRFVLKGAWCTLYSKPGCTKFAHAAAALSGAAGCLTVAQTHRAYATWHVATSVTLCASCWQSFSACVSLPDTHMHFSHMSLHTSSPADVEGKVNPCPGVRSMLKRPWKMYAAQPAHIAARVCVSWPPPWPRAVPPCLPCCLLRVCDALSVVVHLQQHHSIPTKIIT